MIATWLASLAPSLVKRVLLSLGFGVAVITGVNHVGTQLNELIASSFNGIPGDMLAVMNLAGLGTGLNFILGAVAARLTLYVLISSSRVIGV
jgi:hypothetical protein